MKTKISLACKQINKVIFLLKNIQSCSGFIIEMNYENQIKFHIITRILQVAIIINSLLLSLILWKIW